MDPTKEKMPHQVPFLEAYFPSEVEGSLKDEGGARTASRGGEATRERAQQRDGPYQRKATLTSGEACLCYGHGKSCPPCKSPNVGYGIILEASMRNTCARAVFPKATFVADTTGFKSPLGCRRGRQRRS